MAAKNTPENFWTKVDKRGPDECWPWISNKTPKGYGAVGYFRRHQHAHRIAFYLTHNYFPPVVMHTCDNRGCCNPGHLRGGTQLENIQDMVAKKRHSTAIGERSGMAKLTDKQVAQIKYLIGLGFSRRDVSNAFGVSKTTIDYIGSGKTWKHVEANPNP